MLRKITFLLFVFFSQFLFAQDSEKVDFGKRYIADNARQWQLTPADVSDMYVSDNYADDDAVPLRHIYFIQRHAGIQLFNGVLNLNIMPDDRVIYAGCRFMPNLATKINTITPKITHEQALTFACQHLNLNHYKWERKEAQPEFKIIFDKSVVSHADIPVQLMYQRINDNEVRLAYSVKIDAVGGSDYWSVRIDAVTGEMLEKNSLTAHCKFHDHRAMANVIASHECEEQSVTTNEKVNTFGNSLLETGTYNVFAMPTESPLHGSRQLLVKPMLDSMATPFGWHDTDGILGTPNYTITRGNNVHAYEDTNNKNATSNNEPNGGKNLVFDYYYSKTAEPDSVLNAATVNLFYMNNYMHDLAYVYGMNEKAGAFQQNNYGRASNIVANDAVQAEAQDGSGTDNANFATPADGGKPRMQMYVWTGSASNILKVTSPATIAGTYEGNNPSNWGKKIDNVPTVGELIIVKDNSNSTLACGTITMDLTGKIAVIDRGTCEFGKKALNAQKKGAIAVIIVNFDPSAPGMAAGASGGQVTIPVLSVSSITGNALKNAMKDGPVMVSLAVEGEQIKPTRVDGDFDNGIIAHEYGHGISNRLTGGPSLDGCLNNGEQMGEGWSDFMGLISTAKPGDKANMAKGIGNFASRGNVNSPGIRSSPYSYDMSINPNTYSQTTGEGVHRLGEVWASMCWDLYWRMVEIYGFDPDIMHGKGGNNKAIKLVFDGMKIQACQPGFVDGRDAILAADQKNFNGEHTCLIWEVFTRRGLGSKSDQGSPLDNGDPKEDFTPRPECLQTLKIEKEVTDLVKAGGEVTVRIAVRNDRLNTTKNTVVTDIIPQGCTYVAGSASKGGSFSNGVVSFNLGDFKTGAKDTVTYKFKTPEKINSISLDYEGFLTESAIDKWDSGFLDDAKQGSSWIPQSIYTHKDSKFAAGCFAESPVKADAYLQSPSEKAFTVTGKQPVLRFYHYQLIQQGFDALVVYISKDNGATWNDVQTQLFKNPYNGRVSYNTISTPNQYGFWGNAKDWVGSYVDLKNYVGEKILVRFRFAADDTQSSGKFEKGSFLDDIEYMDMVNYSTAASIVADNEAKVSAEAIARGTIIETDRATTNIKETLTSVKAEIFPNPAHQFVNIQLVSEKPTTVQIAMFDINGRQVKANTTDVDGTQMITFDTSHLPAGLYTVKISQDNASIVRKLIVY
jgi:extracellular elastinolytic metalloproteinase